LWREGLKGAPLWCPKPRTFWGCSRRTETLSGLVVLFFFLRFGASLRFSFPPFPLLELVHKRENVGSFFLRRGGRRGENPPYHQHRNETWMHSRCLMLIIFTLTSSYFSPMSKMMRYKHSNTFPPAYRTLFLFFFWGKCSGRRARGNDFSRRENMILNRGT
jgi:hypothetical protein